MSGIMQVNTPVESFDVRGAIEHAEKQSNAQSILTVREAIMSTTNPQLILIFSGKRKSGKDYVTDLIHTRLGADACCILRLSGPLKEQYAKEHGLDYSELLGAGQYKEKYRADMIKWGERRREQDPGFFCRLAIREAKQPVWIISDARRLSDVQWFWREFPKECRCVRVEASEQTRLERGWKFTPGIDDAESECGLDQGVPFDWTISNDGDAATLEEQLKELFVLAKNKCADNGHKKTTN